MPRHDMTLPMITCASCKHSYADSALFCPNCGTPKARDAVTASDPLIGKVLGERFQILGPLGQGGSGSLYRAEHVTLRRKVAIKILHNELSRDDLAVERFRREATTVAEIDNEHIVEIHDFGRTPDGRLYLAMELLEGETLDHVLEREKTLSVERAADILIQVGEALMEAHAIGYVHRDLRPRNIYLAVRRGKANFVKLLDFGLAKLVESDAQAASTSLGMTFGDPRYMSPEQARGDRIDRRADIYQLGCVAYEMLTGAPPFTGNRVFDILSKQVTEIPAPLPTRRPGVPLWIEACVAKMLAKDPENRFATTTRMVEALRLGLETGQVMEDEIARRRESIPPPSVSRVMQKMGISTPIDPAPPAAQPAVGSHTLRGHMEPGTEAPRRRTGTPQVGVPVVPAQPPVAGQIEPRAPQPAPAHPSAPVYVTPPSGPVGVQTVHGFATDEHTSAGFAAGPSQAPAMPPPAFVPGPTSQPPAMPPPVAATPSSASPVITPMQAHAPVAASPVPAPPVVAAPVVAPAAEASGRARRASSSHGENPGVSSAWFDDGEAASAEADRIASRKQPSTSSTDLSLYDEAPPRRRWPLVALALGGLALVGGIAFALTRGGDEKPATKTDTVATTQSPVTPTDVPPSQIITPEGSGSQGSAQQVATKPVEAGKPGTPTTPATPTTGPTKSGGVQQAGTNTGTAKTTDDRRPKGPDWFGGGGDTTPTNTTPTNTTPTNTTPTNTTPTNTTPTNTTPTNTGTGTGGGVSGADGPADPYGDVDAPPTDDAAPEKKAEFFSNLGKTQLASGDVAGAAASFKKALELDARNVPAVIGMGEIALRQGLFGDAIAHLKKATKLAPKSSHVFTLLGEAYLGANNSAAAVDAFKKALQLDPDNARARDGFTEAQSHVPPPQDD